MRTCYLEEARPAEVSQVLRATLQERGALIRDHRHSSVRFTGPEPERSMMWTRGGYLGIYQHQGEDEVAVRLVLRARWPHRILWTVATLNVLVAILVIAINPSGTAWFAAALLLGFALVAAVVTYIGTLRPVHREEAALMAALEAALVAEIGDVESQQARDERRFEADLEGEVLRRQLAGRTSAKKARAAATAPDAADTTANAGANANAADAAGAAADASPAKAKPRARLKLPRFGRKKKPDADEPSND